MFEFLFLIELLAENQAGAKDVSLHFKISADYAIIT